MNKHGDTKAKLAEYLGIHPKTLYLKYAGLEGRSFNQVEIKKIAERYQLTPEQIVQIFLS